MFLLYLLLDLLRNKNLLQFPYFGCKFVKIRRLAARANLLVFPNSRFKIWEFRCESYFATGILDNIIIIKETKSSRFGLILDNTFKIIFWFQGHRFRIRIILALRI